MTLSSFAATLSRLAEAEWTRACENVRRSAPSIGNVGEWRALCEGGWSGPVPGDLPDVGMMDHERERRINETVDKGHDVVKTLMPPQPPVVATGSAHSPKHPESPTSPLNPKLPPSARRSSDGHLAAERSNSNTMLSRPPSPPGTQGVISNISKKPGYTGSETEYSPVTQQVVQARSSSDNGSTGTALSLHPAAGTVALTEHANISPNDDGVSMPKDSSRPIGKDFDPEDPVKAEVKPSHKSRSVDLPPPFSNRDVFGDEQSQGHFSKKVDFMDERERKITPPSKPSGVGRNVNTGGHLDRRLSIESMTSNLSLVATMRDRYDTRLVGFGSSALSASC